MIRPSVPEAQIIRAALRSGLGPVACGDACDACGLGDEDDAGAMKVDMTGSASDLIFAAAGLAEPDISNLSDEFLAAVRGMPQRKLAVELLRKLLGVCLESHAERATRRSRMMAEAA
jgi:hypothetical protein